MAEYGMMVQTIEIKPDIADAPASEFSQYFTAGLNQIVQKASKGLNSFEGGGWSFVSHDLTKIDHHLVLSLLIQKGF
ncbi:hypothetical protein KAR91_00430 [Candidatus Pacearchaeota archaeon]|nr:hypothetical protein [Candidatus Pacearchaeota archaeon]